MSKWAEAIRNRVCIDKSTSIEIGSGECVYIAIKAKNANSDIVINVSLKQAEKMFVLLAKHIERAII